MSNKNSGEEKGEIVAGESAILHDLGKGVVAGLVATIGVAVLIFLQGAMGLVPGTDFIAMLARIVGGGAMMGWVVLFVGGGLLGIAFASLDGHVEHVTGAGEIVHGVLFGVLLWAALMLVLLPLISGNAMGVAIAVFVGALVYGVVMGAVYGALNPEEASN